MSGYFVDRSDYLAHHGIKGQKWGIRRYQNADGSLTAEGMKRYGVNPKTGKMSKYGEYLHLKDISNSQKKPSNDIKTYTDEQLEYRKKTLKIIAAASAITVGALVAYKASTSLGAKYIDKTLKPGTKIRRVVSSATMDDYLKRMPKNVGDTFKDPIYATYKKSDSTIYKANYKRMFGNGPREFGSLVTAVNKKPIKVASVSSGEKVFNELRKSDKEFGEALKGITYRKFNSALVSESKEIEPFKNKYYNALKNKGYSALIDYNDVSTKVSSNPMIIFDRDSLSTTPVTKIKDITNLKVGERVVDDFATTSIFTLRNDPTILIGPTALTLGSAAGLSQVALEQKRRQKNGGVK